MISILQLDKLPEISGIYKVTDSSRTVIYIGQSKNIYRRWKNGHEKYADIIQLCGTDAFITWVELPEWLLNRAENVAISFYKPVLNRQNAPVV